MVISRPLIAIVDDEESVRLALARMLRASLFKVDVFESGEEFLHSLWTSRPDCVVLDFQMPGLTAHDVQLALKEAEISLPIIVVTAHDELALRERCLANGAFAYLAKPLPRKDLIAAINLAVSQHLLASKPA